MRVIYVQNRLSTSAIWNGFIHYELWHQKKSTYDYLHVWGGIAYAQVPKETRKKIDKTAQKWMFVGYTEMASQYGLYDSSQKCFFISRDVVFEKSTSYHNTNNTVGQASRNYYMAPIEPWAEQQAWGDEFDKEEAPKAKRMQRKWREEEQEEEVLDWGYAGEVLAPFRLRKPQNSSASKGGDGNNDNDNAVEWDEVPVVEKKKRRVSDTPGMVRKLRADHGSSYWGS